MTTRPTQRVQPIFEETQAPAQASTPSSDKAATRTGDDLNHVCNHLPATAPNLNRRETDMKALDNYERLTARFAITMATLICVLFLAGAASAKTITVTGTGDTIAVDGLVTLREAITAANTNAPGPPPSPLARSLQPRSPAPAPPPAFVGRVHRTRPGGSNRARPRSATFASVRPVRWRTRRTTPGRPRRRCPSRAEGH